MPPSPSPNLSSDHELPARHATGVPGLDLVLRGGLPAGSLHAIEGPAGAGKTVLGAQICFHRTAQGGKAVFMTLLAESHGKLANHLRTLDFFNEDALLRSLLLLSGYSDLERSGLAGLRRLVAETIDRHRPDLLVIDGFSSVGHFGATASEITTFVHGLNALVAATRCTALLLSQGDGSEPSAEHNLVDGLIVLGVDAQALRTGRQLEVKKLRGSGFIEGRHIYRITDAGVTVHPRLEATDVVRSAVPRERRERHSFGNRALDEMSGGGLLAASTTSILGPSGSGKTILGLQFLQAGLQRGEACQYFGFNESPERLVAKAEGVGMDLAPHVRSGLLRIFWQPPLELFIDALAQQLLADVAQRGVRRLLLDGVDGFTASAMYPARFGTFFAGLTNALRAGDVTTAVTEELDLFASTVSLPPHRKSALFENLLLLRYIESNCRFRRLIAILKVRESDYDPAIREFNISSQGIDIGAPFDLLGATGQANGAPLQFGSPPGSEGAGR
jgi:circadian clock protein KaiC